MKTYSVLKLINVMFFSLLMLLMGCNSDAKSSNKKDRWLRYEAHHSIIPQVPNWKRAKFKQISYFGRYRHSADAWHNYGGDPYGPIAAIWQVARYLGEKPEFKECGEEPTYPEKPANILRSSPEFQAMEDAFILKRRQYYSCRSDNAKKEEDAISYSHYYARSTDNYVVTAPKRVEDHALYEINASFGPMGGIPKQVLSENQNTELLRPWFCYNLIVIGGTKDCYKLSGEESSLYYNIRSLKIRSTSSQYQETESITHVPQDWSEIKGIQITKLQYEWLEKRCYDHVFHCYMDDTAPELTEEQKVYIKATAWELDNNYQLRDKIGVGANQFRIHP